MRYPTRGWLIAAAVVPLLLIGGLGIVLALRASSAGPPQVGDPAPAFALADLDGTQLRLEDLRGRPVVLNFWASWCGPCVEEFPLLGDAHEQFGDEGLVVLGIVFRDGSQDARSFMIRMDAGWTAAMDPGEEVARRYGVSAPPETFFIGPDGVIVDRQIGQLGAADMERGLAAIMGEE